LNKSASNYQDCINVYKYITSFFIGSKDNKDIEKILKRNKLNLLFELNLGTLRNCQSGISRLKKIDVLIENEYANLYNSIQVLLDVRRNFDIHNVSPLKVGGSINKDLDNIYLPMINTLLKI